MSKEGTGFLSKTVKGTLTVIIVSLVCVLLFAVVVKFFPLSKGTIKTINQFIKALAVVLGCIFSVEGKGGLFQGALIGLFGGMLTAFAFCLLGGYATEGFTLIYELAFGLVVGAIAGVIVVNVKN